MIASKSPSCMHTLLFEQMVCHCQAWPAGRSLTCISHFVAGATPAATPASTNSLGVSTVVRHPSALCCISTAYCSASQLPFWLPFHVPRGLPFHICLLGSGSYAFPIAFSSAFWFTFWSASWSAFQGAYCHVMQYPLCASSNATCIGMANILHTCSFQLACTITYSLLVPTAC